MEECHASYVLQHVPMLLQKILNPLPCKTLNTCARVCKEWNEFSTTIKKTRKKIEWFLAQSSEEEDVNIIAEQIKTFIEELSGQPHNLFLFCTTKLYEKRIRLPTKHPTRRPRNTKCEVVELKHYLQRLIPINCALLAVSADGVVGTSQKTKQISELEDTEALTLLSIPQLDELEIFTFCLDVFTYANRIDENGTGVFDVNQVTTVPEGKEVKAILFFCDEPFCPPEIGYSLLRHYSGCVIAGGNVDNIISPEDCTNENPQVETSLMCVALCGPRVRAASVILREEVDTPEQVETIMKKLKDCNLPERKSFAFMFACIGRGHHHFHGKENVESSVFRKLFPNTPLFGFFGNGEVGFDHLPKYTENSETLEKSVSSTPDKPPPKLYHSYTTIICLISIT